MTDVMGFIAEEEIENARNQLTDAYLNPETPEQTAKRFQKSRMFDLPTSMVETVTPEEEAARRAADVDWAAAYAKAPVMMERMADPAYANLIKEDINNVSMAESLVWSMAPETGQKEGLWGAVRNAFTQGGYAGLSSTPIFGATSQLQGLSDELRKIESIEKDIADGKNVAARFATAEDPTGELGLQAFMLDKNRAKENLLTRMRDEAETVARLQRVQSYFPAPSAVQEFMQAEGLGDSLDKFFKAPLTIMASIGVSSLTQQAPGLLAMGLAGPLGVAAQAGITGAYSYAMDSNASLLENLQEELGIDLTNGAQLYEAFADPSKREAVARALDRADRHAMGVAAMDMVSLGLASKLLLPKSMTQRMANHIYAKEFANMGVQNVVQGAMGGAGEALGQYLADGEISSWADVVAEIIGGQFTAPIEVMSTGMRARHIARQAELKANGNMLSAEELARLTQQSGVNANDPETAAEHLDQAAERAGVGMVSIDAQAFKQQGLDQRYRDVPEITDQLDQAAANGGNVVIPLSVYIQKVKPRDQDGLVASLASFGDTPSVTDAQAESQSAAEAIVQQAREAATETTPTFRRELADVGRAIGTMIRQAGATRKEAAMLQAIIQAQVANLAQSLGISPQAVWNAYGSQIMGEPRVQRDSQGDLVTIDGQQVAQGTGERAGTGKGMAHGSFFPSLRIIARWRNANRSTLLHESAHMFLDMRINALVDLIRNATVMTEAQLEFRNDMQAVFDWLGIQNAEAWETMSADAKRKAQEKFARSFEAYVMEGRAPTDSLKNAFRAFASWLKNIYYTIANIPDSEINDDVRAMFDAMLSADESVRLATMHQGEQALFASAQQGGLTEAEWQEYRKDRAQMLSDAKAEQAERYDREAKAITRLRRRAMRMLRGEAKGRLAEIRADVEKRVKKTKTYRAWDTLKNGKTYEGQDFKCKLFVEDLKILGYTDKEIKMLYDAGLATKRASLQPIPIAQIADDFGYANANELVDDMLKYRDMRRAIDELAAQEFIAQNPQMATDRQLEELADASIFNDAKTRVVETELKALSRMGRQQNRDWRGTYEEQARAQVGRMAVKDCRPYNFVRLANRAARNARNAFIRGEIEAAIQFKRQELYYTCMAKEAKAAAMAIASGHRKFANYRKKEIKAMDTRFLVAIQRVLANMGIYNEQQLSLNPESQSVSQMLDGLTDETGAVFDVDPRLAKALDIHDADYLMTVDGYRQFIDLVEQLDAQGRNEKRISTLEGKVDLAEAQAEVVQEIEKVADEKGRDAQIRVEEVSRWEKTKDFLRRIGLNHFRAATICGVLDGSWGGKLTRLLIHTADKANDIEETLRNKYTERLAKVFAPIEKVLADNTRRTSKVAGIPLSVHEVFVMLLNVGNEGNRQRLFATLKKRSNGMIDFQAGYDMTDPAQAAQVNANADQFLAALFAEYLDERHYQAAQQIWDLFGEIQKETDRVARAMNGRSPVWVQPRAFTVITPNGTQQLTGGYYPIRYDRRLNLEASDIAALDAQKSARPVFAGSSVNDGHLQSRVNVYDHGLTLTARAMFEGLDQQIHYIAWAQWVRDAGKLLNKKGPIAKAIADRYGTEWVNALHDWVKSCREGNARQTEGIDALADLLRSNVSLAGIGFNLVTAALQLTGYAQSLTYLGGKWSSRGMADFLRMGGRHGAQQWVASKSKMMENRVRTQFRELAEVQARITGNRGSLKDRLSRAAYLPVVYMQSYVDLPTWIGAYEKALSEGKSETAAVAEADRAVINTQGSGRLSDLSAYERGNAWAKLMTVFYTFFNAVLQNAIFAGMVKSRLGAAKDMMILLALQPALESFMRSGANELFGLSDDDEDDEEKFKRIFKDAGASIVEYNLGLFVGLRELSYLTGDFGYSGPAGLRKITDTGKALQAIGRVVAGNEVDDSELRAIVSGVGVWAGLPVTPINRFISGAAALERGDTDNPLVMISGYSRR